jgi:hypothetical protein
MKKHILSLIFSIVAGLALVSCSTNKNIVYQRMADLQNAKDDSTICFVKKEDGSTIYYKSLKLVTGIFKTPYLLADNKTRIYASEIIAYQTEDHYAISEVKFAYDGRPSNLAVETLPGFAVRLVKGKVNIYSRKYAVGKVAGDEYFIQVGKGLIYAYSPELMDNLIRKHPEVLKFYNNYKQKLQQSKELKNTAYIFNNAQMISSR